MVQLFPYSKLKDRLKELVQMCFIKNNGQHQNKYVVSGRDYNFCRTTLIIIKLLEIVFIDAIFIMIDGRGFQHLGIPTVLLFSSLCSFSRWKKGFSRKKKRTSPIVLFHFLLYGLFSFT